MPTPRHLHWMASDEIDAKLALLQMPVCWPFIDWTLFFFCICTFAKNVTIDFKCIENHGGTTRSKKWTSSQDCQGIFLELLNCLFLSNTSKTKRLCRWSFRYGKWFCSFKNLPRVLPSLRSNGKVSFDGGGRAQDKCKILACPEKWFQTDSVYQCCASRAGFLFPVR